MKEFHGCTDDQEPLLQRDSLLNAEGLGRIGCVCGGIMDDYKRRLPHYASDISMGWTRKTISSALFMFFATFASTVALGVVIKRNTKCDSDMAAAGFCADEDGSSYLGVTEYLAMNSVAGMLHAGEVHVYELCCAEYLVMNSVALPPL